MYSYKNPYNQFTDIDKYYEYEEAEVNRLLALPKVDLEKLRAEFYTVNYDSINCGLEQGAHTTNQIIFSWEVLNRAVMKRREQDGEITINLRECAITGTYKKFVFKYNNQLYSIKISHPFMLTSNNEQVTTRLTEAIQKHFNFKNPIVYDKEPLPVDNILSDKDSVSLKTDDGVVYGGVFKTRSLENHEKLVAPSVEQALNMIRAKSVIHEYNGIIGKRDLMDKVATLFDKIFKTPNLILNNSIRYKISKFLWSFSKTQYYRDFYQVIYLGVQCFAHEIGAASALLTADMAKLNSIGALKGNLAPISVLRLADVVGDGKLRYIVYCYPLVDKNAAQVVGKLCDYTFTENMEVLKTVSKDEPNIIEIDFHELRKV